jgi:hypothetical protein
VGGAVEQLLYGNCKLHYGSFPLSDEWNAQNWEATYVKFFKADGFLALSTTPRK